MHHFKNLNVDQNSITSARAFSDLVEEDEKITKEKEKMENHQMQLQFGATFGGTVDGFL